MKKLATLAFLVLTSASTSYTQSIEATSRGPCSPNIIGNKGQIQFTCQLTLDADSAKKLNDIWNEITAQTKASPNQLAKLNKSFDS